MVSTPRVSVVVPAYNVSAYLEAALSSVECQSFSDYEVLIVDDGSTDQTAAVALTFSRRDPRFKLLQKSNGGLSSARNHGIRYAKGEYIALLDGDDIYHPDKLAVHIAKLDNSPKVGVTYSASRAIRDDGQQTFMILSGKPVVKNVLSALLYKNFIGHGSNAVFRRCLIDEVGDFDETLRSSEDIDFWLRIAATERWEFDREPRILCYYRVRPSGLSFNVAQMQRSQEQVIQSAYGRSPEVVEPMLPTAYAYMYRYLARIALTAGDLAQAEDFIDQAWESDRSIFWRDMRSLVTLVSVRLSPLTKRILQQALGSVD